jgi:L-threonylcarbamoyladenylate synthase
MVSTSANRAGRPPARTARAVRQIFGAGIAVVVNAPLGAEARPSPIRDAVTGEWARR